MKRFTETEKWRDPWFQKLDRESRTLWLWLCDRVDNAGVVDICWPICNAETGGIFSDETMGDFGERVEKLANGKWWLPKFVHFQFGDLSEVSKVHQSVEKLLSRHSLSHRVGHRVPHSTKDKDKDKDKEEDKEKAGGKVYDNLDAIKVLERLNQRIGAKFRPVQGSLRFISERLKEGFTVEECFGVIEMKAKGWMGEAKTREWLNPHTLFRKEKFPEYVGQIGLTNTNNGELIGKF